MQILPTYLAQFKGQPRPEFDRLQQRNAQQLAQANTRRYDRMLQASTNPTRQSAFYKGYDGASQTHRLLLPNRGELPAKAITNGAMGLKQSVSLSRPAGAIAKVNSMPR